MILYVGPIYIRVEKVGFMKSNIFICNKMGVFRMRRLISLILVLLVYGCGTSKNSDIEKQKIQIDTQLKSLRLSIGTAFVNCLKGEDGSLLYGTTSSDEGKGYLSIFRSSDERNVDLKQSDAGEYLVTVKIAGVGLKSYKRVFAGIGFGLTWHSYPVWERTEILGVVPKTRSGWGTGKSSDDPLADIISGKTYNIGIKISELCLEFYDREKIKEKYDEYGNKISEEKWKCRLIESYTLNKKDTVKINWGNLDKVSDDVFYNLVKHRKINGVWFNL